MSQLSLKEKIALKDMASLKIKFKKRQGRVNGDAAFFITIDNYITVYPTTSWL